jgi:hypothetical protein
MANEITNTAEIAETEWDGHSEPDDVRSDLTATKEAERQGMEFHVQMHGYTLRDMDDLIVEAAARLIVGKHNDREIAKAIEEKCIDLLNKKATIALDTVTSDILDQAMTPTFGAKIPITMREFLGLYGREFLEAKVGSDGKPTTDGWRSTRRMDWLVGQVVERKFKSELELATGAMLREIQAAVKADLTAFLESEKKRVREALATITK